MYPSQELYWLSQGAPGKWLSRRCGIVPVSPGTTGSLPWILPTGMTYKIGFRWLSSYLNQSNPTNLNKSNKLNKYINQMITIITIITLNNTNENNGNIDNNDNNNYFQDRRMFPVLTRVHSQTFWTQCWFVMWLRKGAKPVHTKLNLATPRRLHGRDAAA